MKINGLTINADVLDIIQVLHRQCPKYFSKLIDSDTDLMVQCPYHKDGQERKPSAGIRKSDGMFHCLACGETHSIVEVIAYCFGYKDPMQGYKWLIQNFATTEVQERGKIAINFSRLNNDNVSNVVFPKVNERELDSYRYIHPYMYKRGLTDTIIEMFDLGYDKSTDGITFPVRDKNGDCMFVARRSVSTKRFDLPKGIVKPLYGMYEMNRLATLHLDKVYICEGLFDCLRLWCNGKVAVAGFGCLFNSYQVKQIQDLPCRTVVLALDNDEAGAKGEAASINKLAKYGVQATVIPKVARIKDLGDFLDLYIRADLYTNSILTDIRSSVSLRGGKLV